MRISLGAFVYLSNAPRLFMRRLCRDEGGKPEGAARDQERVKTKVRPSASKRRLSPSRV